MMVVTENRTNGNTTKFKASGPSDGEAIQRERVFDDLIREQLCILVT
jgi:hypothetical protein